MKKYLALLAGLTLLVACEKDPATTPDPGPQVPFTIEMTKISSRSVTAKIIPSDVGMPYIAVIMSKEEYDGLNEGGDFAQAVLTAYAGQGLQPATLLQAGPDEASVDYLSPLTENIVGVFGCDEDGNITTKPIIRVFTTLSVAADVVDCSFDITVTDIRADGAMVTVTPSNKKVMYALFPGQKSVLDSFGGDKLALAQYTVNFMESEGYVDFSNFDSSANLMKGDDFLDCNGLLGGEDQILLCFAVSNNGELLSTEEQIAIKEFKTPDPAASEAVFTFSIDYLTFNSAVTTVNSTRPYEYMYYDTVDKKWLEKNYPITRDPDYKKFMDYIINDGEHMRGTGTGHKTSDYGTLEPSTDYYVFAFASLAGRPTSKLFMEPFTTREFIYKSGGLAEVGQRVLSIENGAIYGAGYAGYGIITIEYIPNEHTVDYFVTLPPIEDLAKWDAFSEDELKKAVILAIGSSNHGSNRGGWFWPLNSDAPFYAVGMDKDGQFGKVNKLTQRIVLGAPSMSSALQNE